MNELIFSQAVIPTISLFQLKAFVEDKLDGNIRYLKAHSATESAIPRDEMLYQWITYKTYHTPSLFINYNSKTMPEDNFSLPLAVEMARRYNVWECWIDRIDFYIANDTYGKTIYQFKNKPITQGSNAEAFIYNYYQKDRIQNKITRIPRRHLELIGTQVIDKKGAHLDWHITHSPTFIAWMNTSLEGIVFKKEVKKTSDDFFVDLNITPI